MSDPKDAAELMQEAEQEDQQKREEQQAVLDELAEQEGAEVLETTCNIVGDYTVTLKAKLNGEIMDTISAMDARVERYENGDARAYEVSETADDTCQLLADVIDGSEWDKDTFYEFYRAEGLEPLGELLSRVLESLQTERERKQGAAEGFRPSQ